MHAKARPAVRYKIILPAGRQSHPDTPLTDPFERLLKQLLRAPKVRASSLDTAPLQQGVYVLWLSRGRRQCLKVGIAGPRRGKGLRGRLRLHLRSHPSNSVLARHLAADAGSPWVRARNFKAQDQRRAFLCDECYFQALAVPRVSIPNLRRLESFLVDRLRPVYVGTVRQRRP